MGIRSPFNVDSSVSGVVDKMLGNAYPVVREVYTKLGEIAYVATNAEAIIEAGNAALNTVGGVAAAVAVLNNIEPRLDAAENVLDDIEPRVIAAESTIAALEDDLIDLSNPTGASLVGYSSGGTGSINRTIQAKLQEFISITDTGATTSATASANDTAIANAMVISNQVWVPPGTYVATVASINLLKDMDGPGFISIGVDTIPAGDIESNLTLTYFTVWSSMADIFSYLSTRSIRRGAVVTISIPAGIHTFTDCIEPYHNDGSRIAIIGAGSTTTTLKFTGLGSATSKAGIRLIGDYYIGLVNGLTLDGDDWSGHANGGPTLGGGNANDPMGVQAKNGASITMGPDVKVYRFARNGVFAYQGATIKADYCTITECGSDAIVASTGSNVRAIGAQVINGWGVGFYADYLGVIWADTSSATGMKLRAGKGGDGYAANFGGQIYAPGSSAIKCADSGYSCFGGNLVMDNSVSGGSSVNANLGYGVRCQSGGTVLGANATSTWNKSGGILVTGGAQYIGDGSIFNDNGVKDTPPENPPIVASSGVTVSDGGVFVSASFSSIGNTKSGIVVEKGAHASIPTCTVSSNKDYGINCSNATVRATSAVGIRDNGLYGVYCRYGGIVDMDGVSEALKITGNGSGACTPAKDTTVGTTQSTIYASD